MNQPISVAIIEDDTSYAERLQVILNGIEGNNGGYFRCAHVYYSPEIALKELKHEKPDVVIVDMNLPKMSGPRCIRQLRRLLPDVEILVLTVNGDPAAIYEALEAGATGYLVKSQTTSVDIMRAVKTVHAKGSILSSQVARLVLKGFHDRGKRKEKLEHLSKREMEVLHGISEGDTNKEIAGRLGVAEATVRTHVHNVLTKLEAGNRVQAGRYLTG